MTHAARPTVVRFRSGKGGIVGGGCLLPGGLVLTCAHVVNAALERRGDAAERPDGPVSVDVPLTGHQPAPAEIVAWVPLDESRRGDVALLKVSPSTFEGAKPLLLANRTPADDERLSLFGFPAGHPNGVWKRDVLYAGPAIAGWCQVGAVTSSAYKLQRGFSGCPIFDPAYRVIGMFAAAEADPEVDAGQYIPIRTILDALRAQPGVPIPEVRDHDESFLDYVRAVRASADDFPYAAIHVRLSGQRTIDSVYVPVDVTASKVRGDLDPATSNRRNATLVIAEQMGDVSPARLLFVGGPGSGKSTLLHVLAAKVWDMPEELGLPQRAIPLLLRLRNLALADSPGGYDLRVATALQNSREFGLAYTLPDQFLRSWPETTGSPWMVMLDGLDEIPADRALSFYKFLENFIDHLVGGGHHVVLTSRPFDLPANLTSRLRSFDLLPFDVEQRNQLASNIMGDRAPAFVTALDATLAITDLTPLLVSLAAVIYDQDGSLPPKRGALYRRFIDILLQEANARGLSEALGDTLSASVLPLLRVVAEQMEGPVASAELVEERLAKHIQLDYQEQPLQSRQLAVNFLRSMGRLSSLLIAHVQQYEWLHPTFGEFFRADILVNRVPDPSTTDGHAVIQRLRNYEDRELLAFVLELWASRGIDPVPALRHYWKQGFSEWYDVVSVKWSISPDEELLRELASVPSSLLGGPLMTTDILEAADGLYGLEVELNGSEDLVYSFLSDVMQRYNVRLASSELLMDVFHDLLSPDEFRLVASRYLQKFDVRRTLIEEIGPDDMSETGMGDDQAQALYLLKSTIGDDDALAQRLMALDPSSPARKLIGSTIAQILRNLRVLADVVPDIEDRHAADSHLRLLERLDVADTDS